MNPWNFTAATGCVAHSDAIASAITASIYAASAGELFA